MFIDRGTQKPSNFFRRSGVQEDCLPSRNIPLLRKKLNINKLLSLYKHRTPERSEECRHTTSDLTDN